MEEVAKLLCCRSSDDRQRRSTRKTAEEDELRTNRERELTADDGDDELATGTMS
ncbi:unnamed protein product [Camellia sinensis]